MRRVLLLLVSFLLVAAGLSVATAPIAGSAAPADPLTGRLVDHTGDHPAVVGATVRLRALGPNGPGAVVAVDTTDGLGNFALDAGPTPDEEYYVQVLAGAYQGGYVGGVPLSVQPNAVDAATWMPNTHLGRVWANPAFIRGVVVNSVTKRPVAGVRVTARSANDLTQIEGSDLTNAKGAFVIGGLQCEDDCYLKVNGEPKGYETGYRGCSGQVVPTWGEACASPIGRIGRVLLDRL